MRLRTKLEIVIAISVILGASLPSLIGLERTISDTEDTVYYGGSWYYYEPS